MKKYFSILLILLMSFVLFGCENLEDKRTIKKEFTKSLPNVEYIGIDSEEEREIVYRFKNDDFEFTVSNYLIKDSVFGLDHSNVDTNYFSKSMLYLENDVEDLCDEYDIAFYSTFDKTYGEKYDAQKEFNKTTFLMDFEYTNGAEYLFYVENGNDIDNVFGLMEELEDLVEEYYPMKENELLTMNKEIYLSIVEENKIENEYLRLYTSEVSTLKDWDYDYEDMGKIALYNYANLIKENKIVDDGTVFDKNRPKFLNHLYINDEMYVSNEYEIEFIYNPADDKYYTIVCYGCDFEYNGGVKDYLQREIIETYYRNSDYSINDTTKNTTYKINGNKYRVERNDTKDTLTFYRNGKLLDIPFYDEVCEVGSGATYYMYISIDDFAELMEMEVVEVDLKLGIVYLETK